MDCWPQVRTLEGKTIRTLDQRKPFQVVSVNERRVSLKVSTGKVRPVRRKEIQDAYRELVLEGEITRTQIHARHSPRNPAYVAAILSELAGIEYRVKPIRLFYRSEQAAAGESQKDVMK